MYLSAHGAEDDVLLCLLSCLRGILGGMSRGGVGLTGCEGSNLLVSLASHLSMSL